jgi:hypothetical protein
MNNNYQIRINGEVVETPVAWEWTMYNSMFSLDVVQGIRAYEINVGNSAQLRRLLGYLDDPKNISVPTPLPAIIEQGGVMMDSGVVIVRKTGEDFVLSFSSNLAKVYGDAADVVLSELDFGSVGTFNGTVASTALGHDWEDGWTCPQVKNTAFYGGDGVGGFNGLMNEKSGVNVIGPVLVPMVFLKKILNAAAASVTYSGAAWVSDELEKAVIYSNRHQAGAFDLAKQLPDMTLSQLVMGLRRLWNLWVRVYSSASPLGATRLRIDFVKDWMSKSPIYDWSEKLPKIKGGELVYTDGIRFEMARDNNDELMKDGYFDAYQTTGGSGNKFTTITSEWSGLLPDGGVPSVLQQGISGDRQGKPAGLRLLSYDTATKTSSVGGLKPDTVAGAYWSEWEAFVKQSYGYSGPINLNSTDIYKMANCLNGRNDEPPVIYAQGVNWLVERITVPSVGMPEVVMWRV